jgi:hypothetical protein
MHHLGHIKYEELLDFGRGGGFKNRPHDVAALDSEEANSCPDSRNRWRAALQMLDGRSIGRNQRAQKIRILG